MKVQNFHNKNQFIIYSGESVFFQLYNSIVAKISDCGTLLFSDDWDYSSTTRRHLYLFLKEIYLASDKANSFVRQKVAEALEDTNKRAILQDYIKQDYIKSGILKF